MTRITEQRIEVWDHLFTLNRERLPAPANGLSHCCRGFFMCLKVVRDKHEHSASGAGNLQSCNVPGSARIPKG